MWYYVKITRGTLTYYVVSPRYNLFELSTEKHHGLYLWETEGDAQEDTRWQGLLQDQDDVTYVRTYRGN